MDSLLPAAARILRPGVVQHEAFLFAGTVILAALFFTVGGIFMKLSEGLTKFWPTMIVFALFVTGAALQTLAMKREDLAVSYLVVVGLEAILAFLFGVLGVLRELQSGANCRRIPHRAWHHLVAFGLLTHKPVTLDHDVAGQLAKAKALGQKSPQADGWHRYSDDN
jgi:multidrug transporter EmrE-like cation transporter